MAETPKISDLPDSQLLYDLISRISSEDFEESLRLIEIEIKLLENGQTQVSNIETWSTCLKSVWYLYKALKFWITEGNTTLAHENFKNSRIGFEDVGHKELYELTAGLEVYIEGILEVLKFNVDHGLKKIRNVADHFARAGDFGSKYEKLLDHMNQGTFLLSGASAIQLSDFNSAQVLFEESSRCAENLVEKYYSPGEPNHYFFQGQSKYALGLFKFYWAHNKLNNFAFDTIASSDNLGKEIGEAYELLKNCDHSNKLD